MRVLHIVPDISVSNGIMSIILNYAKYMPDDVVFDVLYFFETETTRKADIEVLGGIVSKTDYPSIKTIFNLKLYNFFRKNMNKWDAIHIHGPHFAPLFAPYAKLAGYRKIFVHCHSTIYSLIGNSNVNHMLSLYSKYFVKRKIACSKESGEFWYGNKKFTIINNAVEPQKFFYNDALRTKKRDELNIGNKVVIGHVGKTDIPQKNHKFLMNVFKAFKKLHSDSLLLLAGALPTDELIALTKQLEIDDSVRFMGARSDINELYQVFDVFVFPSISEGLPVSVVEAQFASLPVIMSDSITDEVVVCDNLVKVSLDRAPNEWAEAIKNSISAERNEISVNENAKKWDITNESQKLLNLYREQI